MELIEYYFLYRIMKLDFQKITMKQFIMTSDTQLFLIQSSKKKDYNKINSKLKFYQQMVKNIHTPTLTDTIKIEQIQVNLKTLNNKIGEIQLSCDQILEDLQSMGFKIYHEAFDNLMEIMKIMNGYLNKTMNQNINIKKIYGLKNDKKFSNICQICSESQEASNLKKIKTQFGMEYPHDQQNQRFQLMMKQNDDIVVREKQQFIDQLNTLLNEKQKFLCVMTDSWRYNQLVNSLSKMSELGDQICQRKNKKKLPATFDDNGQTPQKQLLQKEYINIMKQVKDILNRKLKQGYTSRVKSMLDKFQIVLKQDNTQIIRKNKYIDRRDAQAQTVYNLDTIQIKILKEQLHNKELQLKGLKQGKGRLEQKFNKIIENQRKIAKKVSYQIAALTRSDQSMSNLSQKIKQNEQLKQYIRQLKLSLQNKQVTQSNIKNTNYPNNYGENVSNKLKLKQYSLNHQKKFKLNHSVTLSIDNNTTNQQTQTDAFNLVSLLQCCFDQSQIQKFGKKKLLRRISKNPMREYIHQSALSRAASQVSQIYTNKNQIQSNVWQFVHNEYKTQTQLLRKGYQKLQQAVYLKKDKQQYYIEKKRKKKHINTLTNIITNQAKNASDNTKLKNRITKGSRKQKTFDNLKLNQISEKDENNKSDEERKKENQVKQKYNIQNQKQIERRRSQKTAFNNLNLIRLTQVTNRKFRLNLPKNENASNKLETPHHTVTSKQSVIKINKYEMKKNSRSLDKQKVRQIVSLLKLQKHNNPVAQSRYSNMYDKIQIMEDLVGAQSYEKSLSENNSSNNIQDKKQEELIESKENIAENIYNAKVIIQSQYSYLKASGFIDFLFSIQKKLSLGNRNLGKQKFQFSHITQSDIVIFGGYEDLANYYKRSGFWRKLMNQENELIINYRNRNFAQKISKYFLLLKKMNRQFFEEYMSFLFNPYQFSSKNFGPQVNKQISKQLVLIEPSEDKQSQPVRNQQSLMQVIARLIKYHQLNHVDCQHLAQFLDKIGYYRYTY